MTELNEIREVFGGKWRKWFRVAAKSAPERPQLPRVGEHWRQRDDDPFPPKVTALILETRDGWVRYQVGRGAPFDDQRMTEEQFAKVYRFHARAEEGLGGAQ